MLTDDLRRAFAEFVGTFTLVFAACGSVLASAIAFANLFAQPGGNVFANGLALVAVALAYGLAYAVMASAVGHISGAHFNPATTLAFFVTQRITAVLAGLYWVAQFGAAALAALLLKWIVGTEGTRNSVRLGAPVLGGGIDKWQALVLETVLTAFLVWVVFAAIADPRGTFGVVAGLAIGLVLTMDVLIGGAFTSGAVNPARAFGPQLVQNFWDKAWIWYAGPFAGAAIAGILYDWLYLRPVPRPLPITSGETVVVESATVVERAPGEATGL